MIWFTVPRNDIIKVDAMENYCFHPQGIRLNVRPKYMVMFQDQYVRHNDSPNIRNKSCDRMKQFRYLGTNLTNKNSIQEEIKSGMKSGNVFCHSVQNPLSCSSLYKNIKIKISRNIILPVVLYGCETWSLTSREERRLRVLRRIFGASRDKVMGGMEENTQRGA